MLTFVKTTLLMTSSRCANGNGLLSQTHEMQLDNQPNFVNWSQKKKIEQLVLQGIVQVANPSIFCLQAKFRVLRARGTLPFLPEYSESLVGIREYDTFPILFARSYEERGDLEGAVKTYKKAVKVNLSNSDAREALIAMEVKERKKDSVGLPVRPGAPQGGGTLRVRCPERVALPQTGSIDRHPMT